MRGTKRKKTGAKVCIVLLALAVFIAMLIAWGPWATRGSICEYCGCTRSEKWRLGIKIHDQINEMPVSRWVLQHNPDHRQHVWAFAASQHFSVDIRFFDHVLFRRGLSMDGCGGSAGILYRIWKERETLGEEKALMLLDTYHALLASGDRARLHKVAQGLLMNDQQPVEALLTPADE